MAGIRLLQAIWRPIEIRLGSLALVGATLPGLVGHSPRRRLLDEMRLFLRELPERMRSPLPAVMAEFTPDQLPDRGDKNIEDNIRQLADLAVLLDRRSSLGTCLRRSLTRYYFLQREGVPVEVHFGARFVNGVPDREITGHAWLSLDDEPYHEDSANWRDFTVMISYPQGDESDGVSDP
jgi:hypothetical protein